MPRDQRLYMTFPIDFWTHPKVSRLSDAAFRAFVEANGHSRMRETDGVIEADDAQFMWRPEVLEELALSHPSRPLMVRAESGEYVIRDYADHQFTKADREELTRKRSEAGARGAAAKASKREASAEQELSKSKQVLSNSEQTQAGIGKGLETGKEIEEPKNLSAPAVPDLFDAFWSLWPRKEGKVDAVKAWAKAVRKIDQTLLLELARQYVQHPNRPAKQFVPHGATWLNGERWNDGEPTAPEAQRPMSNTEHNAAYVRGLMAQEQQGAPLEIAGAA